MTEYQVKNQGAEKFVYFNSIFVKTKQNKTKQQTCICIEKSLEGYAQQINNNNSNYIWRMGLTRRQRW